LTGLVGRTAAGPGRPDPYTAELAMRMHYVFVTIPVLLGALAGCAGMATPAADPVRAEAAIRAADARWLAAARAHDLERSVSYWSDDAVLLVNGSAAIVGKDAIRRYVTGAFAIPDFSISWTMGHVVVAKSGDLAYATGTNRISMTTPQGKPVVERNNAVEVWKKEPDGSWKCVVDIANSAGT
jgi:uncharacterized protein (TIGR02246 family)